MKKLVLLTVALCIGFLGFAQIAAPKMNQNIKTLKATTQRVVGVEPIKAQGAATPAPKTPEYRNPNAVSVMDIGTSANAYGYGYGGGQKTIVYYNSDINALTNFHRMGGELDPGGYSGDLGYDISLDGGQTWTNMVECFVATEPSGQYYADAGRYPQALIYNPEGNTDPANAHLAFFAATLDGSNDGFGGYGYGVQKIGAASNVDTTKNLTTSENGVFQYIPEGMAITQAGVVITTDADYDVANTLYNDQLIINRGVWSDAAQDIVYEKIFIDAPIVDKETTYRPACTRVAFAPTGDVGYIVMLGNNGENEPVYEDQKSYHPMVFKTEDGGETWSDVINIQLDGPDGISGILDYMTDAQIDSLFTDPNPARDEIAYTTAFDCDFVVDANGNPHIAVGVAPLGSDDYSIISGNPYYAIFDIWSPDGGDTWQAVEVGRPSIMRGEYGVAGGNDSYTEDSRVCAATDWAGTKIFFSWVDTDPEVNPDENTSPDVWVRGFDPEANMLTAGIGGADLATNVTFGSAAMWQSYFATMSSYVITNGDAYTLPITIENMTVGDPGAAVQYKYIKDFSFTDADFTISVGPAPLVADFEADNTSIEENATVNFTDLSTGGANEWSWEFEGGTPATSTDQNPSVVYATAGNYDVTLTVTNAEGDATKTKEEYISVTSAGEPPVADFTADKTVVAYGEAVTFTDLSTGATAWSWEFEGGDPASSNEQNPVVTYNSSDKFNVKLTVTNAFGENMKEMADYIEVHNFTAIAEEFAAKFNVYPNPTNGQLNIAYSEINEDVEVSIIDNVGRIVAQRQINPTMGSQVINIDLSDLNNGIYQVQFTGAVSTIVKKVVVQ